MKTVSQEQLLKCARKFVLSEREPLISKGPQPEIALVWRGTDAWAIQIDGMDVLNRNNEPEYEPMPSSRDDDFKARTRFSFDEAWSRAVRLIEEHGWRTTF